MQNGRRELSSGAAVRWMLEWDSPGEVAWNSVALAVQAVAVVSWRRTPVALFSRAGTGRWWALFATVALTVVLSGFWVPIGAVVWFGYWRPRLRRAVASAVLAAPAADTITTAGGRPTEG